MGSAKESQQENSNAPERGGEAPPPPYGDEAPQASFRTASTTPDSRRPDNRPAQDATRARPTVDSPFNFPPAASPAYSDLPEVVSPATPYSDLPEVVNPGPNYSNLPEAVFPTPGGSNGGGSSGSSSSSSSSYYPSTSSTPIVLAIPQVAAKPTSPFPPAYNRAILLRRGITQEAFTSFLSTLSAFLTANVSERALTHALDVGRSLNVVPKWFSKETLAYAKEVGRRAEQRARSGNLIGAGVTAIAGAVAIPTVTALRVVGAAVSLPAAVGGGLAKKPLSPRERADAYVAVAQRDWFGERGLTAALCSTAELLVLLQNVQGRNYGYGSDYASGSGSGSGLGSANENDATVAEATVRKLVDLAHRSWERGPAGQLRALQGEFGLAPLDIGADEKVKFLDIGAGTLWLVLTETPPAARRSEGYPREKGGRH
ncbi:hypothetical protein F5Y09DRAFT_288165 [Xylaria sp. FL1042]|nr:hypothetical protein F5Y09DRAFT_288165 [Xylaria sp. FL1042]